MNGYERESESDERVSSDIIMYAALMFVGLAIAFGVTMMIFGEDKPEPTVHAEDDWCLIGHLPFNSNDGFALTGEGSQSFSVVTTQNGYELYQKCGKIE